MELSAKCGVFPDIQEMTVKAYGREGHWDLPNTWKSIPGSAKLMLERKCMNCMKTGVGKACMFMFLFSC